MRQIKTIFVLTDNAALAAQAKTFVWPNRAKAIVHSIEHVCFPTIDDTVAIIVDATQLSEKARKNIIKNAGLPKQRIIIGDSRFDNILGKSHLLANVAIEELASALDSIERFINPNFQAKPESEAKDDANETVFNQKKACA